jgi:hypothetical protein
VAQQPSSPQTRPLDLAHQVLPFPVRKASDVRARLSAPSATRPAIARKALARRRVIRQVVVLEVAGRLSEVVEDLDLAIQLALADEPRGVVCDMSAVLADVEQVAVEVLATAGRHARDWPGTPVAVACPDPGVRMELAAHPLGAHLIVSPSLFSAISEVLATPTLAVERLQLTPHPTAPRASRDFVARTLRAWRLDRAIPFASSVVSELVASSSRNVGTDIELSVVWNLGALRLALRDHGPVRPSPGRPADDPQGRGSSVVPGLSRAFGVLPAADGGQLVWAVLEAARTRPPATGARSAGNTGPTGSQKSPVLTVGRGPAPAGLLTAKGCGCSDTDNPSR